MADAIQGLVQGLLVTGITAALIGVPMIAWRLALGPWRCSNCGERLERRPQDRRSDESTRRATMRTHTKWCVS